MTMEDDLNNEEMQPTPEDRDIFNEGQRVHNYFAMFIFEMFILIFSIEKEKDYFGATTNNDSIYGKTSRLSSK